MMSDKRLQMRIDREIKLIKSNPIRFSKSIFAERKKNNNFKMMLIRLDKGNTEKKHRGLKKI